MRALTVISVEKKTLPTKAHAEIIAENAFIPYT